MQGGRRPDALRTPRPEQTTLNQLVQQHAAITIAHNEASTGAEFPGLVKDQYCAFLECGILTLGSLRLRCGECGHDKLLAFSCKCRGFCLSGGARRMSLTAAPASNVSKAYCFSFLLGSVYQANSGIPMLSTLLALLVDRSRK